MTTVTDWLKDFVVEQRSPDAVGSWVAGTADAIVDAVTLPDDLGPTLLAAIEEHWLAFLASVTVDVAGTPALVPSAGELAVQVARHHLGLPVLLKIYQVAQEASWDFAVGIVRDAPEGLDHEALLVWFWTKANRWFGSSVELSVAEYSAEFDRIRRRGDARRYELTAAVLDGAGVSLSEFSAQLGGYPITGVRHCAVIAHALDADSIERLEPAVAGLVAGARMTTVRPGGRELWGWVAVRGDSLIVDDSAIDASSIRVTVGGPAEGIDGFIAAHRDALAAQRIALSSRRRIAVTRYDDVAALTLISADAVAAQRFARATLRGLADPDLDALRETVRVVLTSTESADSIADSLGVHKNTVRYRVQQAERLLGCPLRTRAGDLLLALDYFDAFVR